MSYYVFYKKIGGLVPTRVWLFHIPAVKKRQWFPLIFSELSIEYANKNERFFFKQKHWFMTKNFQMTYSLILFYGWKRSLWMTKLLLAIRGKSRTLCQLSVYLLLGIQAGFKWFQGVRHSNWVPGAFLATEGNIWLFWFNENQFKIYSSVEQRKKCKINKMQCQ